MRRPHANEDHRWQSVPLAV